jgi:hypothetical protein
MNPLDGRVGYPTFLVGRVGYPTFLVGRTLYLSYPVLVGHDQDRTSVGNPTIPPSPQMNGRRTDETDHAG